MKKPPDIVATGGSRQAPVSPESPSLSNGVRSGSAAAAGEEAELLPPSRSRGGVPSATSWCPWFLLEIAAARSPDAVALVTEEGCAYGPRITYAALLRLVRRADAALRAHGVGEGTKVMLVSEISSFAMVAALAVIRIGAVFMPSDPKDPPALRAATLAEAAAESPPQVSAS